mgnify:CR=1 FL=1
MNLPKFNSADGRCYWMKPEVQEELQPLFDQCIQDAIDGRITRLDDSHWPPVVVSSQGAPFEVWQLLRAWTEIQRAETLDAEKAIAFSENLRRQSRWGEIDHHLLDMLKRELQEKYFVATGDEDDRFWDREYSLKPGIRAEQIPEPLLRFACYVAVSYKVYGLDFQYLDANYLFGLVEKVRPDMVKKLREHGTGRLPLSLQKRKTEHFTASANDAFAVIRITARDNTEECCHEVLDYLCAILEQEDFPRSYAVEFKGPEKSYLPITGLPKKGVNQLFACAVQYPGLHPLMERYARLAMRQYEQYTNLSDEQCALPGSFAVFALGMLGQEWQQLVWDYLGLCDDEHSHLQEKFLRLRRPHDGHLIGGALLSHAVHGFRVGPALDPALHRQPGAHRQDGRLLGDDAPGDAGQVVRPAVPAVHRQDQVADLPAQRRPAQGGSFAQNARELNLVKGGRTSGNQLPDEHGDHQPGTLAAAVVEGAQLAGKGQHVPGMYGVGLQQRPGQNHRQPVLLAGKPLHRQGKAVKALAVVYVGQLRLPGGPPAQAHAVEVVVHSHPPRLLKLVQLMPERHKIDPFQTGKSMR